MYTIEFSKDVEKDLAKIPKIHVTKILEKISNLTHNPRPQGVKALQSNLKGLYRIRSGNYRVVYQIIDFKLIVLITHIAIRGNVYD